MALLEFLAGVGAGCIGLLAFFRWLWDKHNDALIKRGPCAYCRKLLDVEHGSSDHEHWRVCPKHPARAEVARLEAQIKRMAA